MVVFKLSNIRNAFKQVFGKNLCVCVQEIYNSFLESEKMGLNVIIKIFI